MENLGAKKIMLFGLGGVGGYIADTLARAGVGNFLLIDCDKTEKSNLNRQIVSTSKNLGRYKSEIMRERILSINKNACVEIKNLYFDKGSSLSFQGFDWIIDAIDSVGSKLEIIARAEAANVPVISCMGAGKRLDPRGFSFGNLFGTSVCPLAKRIRKAAKEIGLKDIPVIFSTEPPIAPKLQNEQNESGVKTPLGSISYSVAAAGMLAAYFVLDKLNS